MKKIMNSLSVAVLFGALFFFGPNVATATEDFSIAPSDNHRKSCFWKSGCKFKVDRSCFGSNC